MKTALIIIYIFFAGLLVLVFLQNQKINKLKRDLIKSNTGNPVERKGDSITAGDLISLIKDKLNEKNTITISN